MNNTERERQTLNAWRVEQGYPPLEPPADITVAYRVGWALGAAMAAGSVLVVLAGIVYLIWRIA